MSHAKDTRESARRLYFLVILVCLVPPCEWKHSSADLRAHRHNPVSILLVPIRAVVSVGLHFFPLLLARPPSQTPEMTLLYSKSGCDTRKVTRI
jgi:hypothetical protein